MFVCERGGILARSSLSVTWRRKIIFHYQKTMNSQKVTHTIVFIFGFMNITGYVMFRGPFAQPSLWNQCQLYEGCSNNLWPEHEGEEIQGSFNVSCMGILQVNIRTSTKKMFSDSFAILARHPWRLAYLQTLKNWNYKISQPCSHESKWGTQVSSIKKWSRQAYVSHCDLY